MKVQRDDPAAVRAGKWAQRWEGIHHKMAFVLGLSKRQIAYAESLPESETRDLRIDVCERDIEATQRHRNALRARALLWRREVAHRERESTAARAAAAAIYFGDDSDYRAALLEVVQALSPDLERAIYNGTVGRLLFPEKYDNE